MSDGDKEALLKWAHAHAVLLPVFAGTNGSGSRHEPEEATIASLMANPLNAAHFAALRAMATHVGELCLTDEAYLAPLRDLEALGQSLRADAWLAKALQEALCVYAAGRGATGRRSSNRRAR